MKTLIALLGAVALVGCASQSGPAYVAERQSPAETEAMIRDSNRFPQPSRPDSYTQSYDPGLRNSNIGGPGYSTYSPNEVSHGHSVNWGNNWGTGGYYRW